MAQLVARVAAERVWAERSPPKLTPQMTLKYYPTISSLAHTHTYTHKQSRNTLNSNKKLSCLPLIARSCGHKHCKFGTHCLNTHSDAEYEEWELRLQRLQFLAKWYSIPIPLSCLKLL